MSKICRVGRNIVGLSGRCQMLEICRKFVGQFPGHRCVSRNIVGLGMSGRCYDIDKMSSYEVFLFRFACREF